MGKSGEKINNKKIEQFCLLSSSNSSRSYVSSDLNGGKKKKSEFKFEIVSIVCVFRFEIESEQRESQTG